VILELSVVDPDMEELLEKLLDGDAEYTIEGLYTEDTEELNVPHPVELVEPEVETEGLLETLAVVELLGEPLAD
jgi:hypothetical protein